MKYTKGPWTGGRESINAPDGRLIATVYFKGVTPSADISIEEGHANSALIAICPEMYEALKELIALDETSQNQKLFRFLATVVKELVRKGKG